MESISIRRDALPAKLEELSRWILVGKQILKAHKAKLAAIKKLDVATAAKEAALEDAQDVAEILLDAEARLGEMLRHTPKTKGGRGKTGSAGGTSLSDLGIDKKQSHEAQQLHQHQDVVEKCKAEAREKGEIVTSRHVLRAISGAHVSHNSGDNEWYTPEPYIEAARSVMGIISLDPASSDLANTTVKASRYCTPDDDGLKQSWKGCVWMNPPYAGELIKPFCHKLVTEFSTGRVTQACVLVNNATETQWFQEMAALCSAMCLPAGRVKFWHPDKVSAPLQGQAVLYFGSNDGKFAQVFHPFGAIFLRG